MPARLRLACAAPIALLACGVAAAQSPHCAPAHGRAPYWAPGCLCDPVVTHTNGMRLASSEAHRSHNVYWQCDQNRIGYCDGRAYGPIRNDWRSLGTRHLGRFTPPPTPNGPTRSQTVHSHDGMEEFSGETLGTIRPAPFAASAGFAQPAGVGSGLASFGGAFRNTLQGEQGEQAAEPQTQTGNWFDAINEISRKMTTAPAP